MTGYSSGQEKQNDSESKGIPEIEASHLILIATGKVQLPQKKTESDAEQAAEQAAAQRTAFRKNAPE